MKDKIMKDKILVLMEKELTEQLPFLSKNRISELIQKFQYSELSSEEKHEVVNHILANYIGDFDDADVNQVKDMNQVEDMIDYLLRDVEWK